MPPSLPIADPELADTAAALAEWQKTLPRRSRLPYDQWSRATEFAGVQHHQGSRHPETR